MAVELSWSTNSGTGSDNSTIEFGAVASGELLVLQVWFHDHSGFLTLPGWTRLGGGEVTLETAQSIVFYKVATGTETTIAADTAVDSWLLAAYTGWDESAGLTIGLAYYEAPALSDTHISPGTWMVGPGKLLIGLAVDTYDWTTLVTPFNTANGTGGFKKLYHSHLDVESGLTASQEWTSLSDAYYANAVSIGIPALAAGRRNKCLGLLTHFCPL